MTKRSSPPPAGGYLFPRLARFLRDRAGISRSEMARRLDVQPAAVTQFEDPTTPVTEQTLRSYAGVIGIPFEQALRESLAGVEEPPAEQPTS